MGGATMAIQTDVSDSAMAAAIEANFLDAFKGFDSYPAFHLHSSPQMVWFDTPEIPYPLPNGVMRANLAAGDADAEIDRVSRHFQAHKLPALWWLWPSSKPDDLADRLVAHGWTAAEGTPGMAADLQQLPAEAPAAENLEIVRVANDDLLRQWRDVMEIGFELPERLAALFYDLGVHAGFGASAWWHNFVGLLDGKPVACGSLVYGAGVAGIYNIATLQEARGKGIGTAITNHALIHARAMGYRVAILGATEMGYRIYERLGFKEYFKIAQYLFSPAS